MSEDIALYASEVIVGAMERGLPIGELAREIARREIPPSAPTLESIQEALSKLILPIYESDESLDRTHAFGFNSGIRRAIKLLKDANT